VNEYCRLVLRAVCAALILTGCAHPLPPDPAASLKVLADALTRADPAALWPRMSANTRARVSEAELASAWTESVVERALLADRLRTFGRASAMRAEVDSGGDLATLVHEKHGWRLSSPRPAARGAATPEEALRRFTAALEAHDLDALLRLLAEPLKGLIERELTERITGLRAAAGRPISSDDEHAQIRYDARHHLDLRRENGQWQIVDFN
jgi:hypothetical protein